MPVRGSNRPPRPRLPDDAPRVPRDVHRDLRAAAGQAALADVAKAYAVAGEALAEGDAARAVEVLAWAKSAAPRSVALREALGVAQYHAGDFAKAHSELLAYRRLSERQDQNHLLADCARALGRPEKAAELVDQMLGDPAVSEDRKAEGLIVLAGSHADRGDLDAAMGVLERTDLAPDVVEPWHPRLWYAAADLAERMDDRDRARDLFEAIAAVDTGFLDTRDRLAALDG